MFIDSLLVGLVVGKIRGGNFKSFLDMRVKNAYLIIFAFLTQFLVIYFYSKALLFAVTLSYLILFIFSIFNRHLTGLIYIAIGMALNLIVMVANGGRMPVDPHAAGLLAPEDLPALLAGEYGKHIAISDHTLFNFLGDIFYLQAPYPHPIIISLGDIVISIGVFLFIQKTMVKKHIN
ncbi:DUF5317 domain-containing protein [Neobacillus sp. D3-1R]|uniref:DUF5317 domain-containing protein n=1 Tax=Neobacillus sp. D3-1R TaxID=3445778 RepID=UPI003F9FABA7